ncbi:SUMF1/EgtB/PvdO family nonheme iron enzyme [Reinekea marina]|uniref:Formylglycine-generating enzyme family protein n=1 Tax=Reinekea marina TaxID=1310421 RepID=A0ABV7WTW8_9GAMM|nr:SUMF1/EgtB/PvdO family nonheme iron enzyme [Reinekea marina]MDN3650909.1 SUMF1/EgtB/PvdO family nonheme iron enzyme [Reinekea marina]
MYRALTLSLAIIYTTAHAADIKERTDAHGIAQVWVPPGTFMMGTDNPNFTEPSWAVKVFPTEAPRFETTITEGYWIDKYEATNESFQAFVDADGYTTEAFWSKEGWDWISGRYLPIYPIPCHEGAANLPRACITWYEAEAYAAWRGGRLPTEAEWEYAAAGPSSLIFPWGNEWQDNHANIGDTALPVGSLPAGVSWVGAHDMSGNVMEWVSDWINFDFDRSTQGDNPTGSPTGFKKMEKGGWYGSHPNVSRNAYHHFEDAPIYQDSHIGVRVVTPAKMP